MPPPASTPQLSLPLTDPHPQRARQPSQRVLNILQGNAADPKPARGVQLPSTIPKTVDCDLTVIAGKSLNDDDVELGLNLNEVTANAKALKLTSIAEVQRHPEWPQWEHSIHEELATLHKASTWELVDPPAGANIVGSKWVFRAKKDAAGNVICYKAHLVAQEFLQVPGIDYFDMYALVAKLVPICTVLALTAQQDLELHQVDIKGAYLNGELTDGECIYMR